MSNLVTRGLGGTNLVTFGLGGFFEITVTIRGGGGATIRPPVYKPYEDDEDEPWKPREDEEQEIVIRVRISGREVQRHYFVRKRTQTVVIQLINMVNVTITRVSINVGKFIKSSKSAVVALTTHQQKEN